MTLQEFFENIVLSVMGEGSSMKDSYEDTYVGIINAVLADCFNENNSILVANGLEPVPAVVWYNADDVIPYDLQFLLTCVCYGCGSRLFIDEAGDEANMVGFLESQYTTNKSKYTCAEYVDVKGVWS